MSTQETATYPKMNPEWKDKWLKALRSGEYQQGTGLLCCVINGQEYYCCLGVLAHIAGEPQGRLTVNGYIWQKLADKVGLPANAEEEARVQGCLITMNDTRRVPFAEIANWIEENL